MLAGVAELVDALDSKSSNSNVVRVRFPPPVQNKIIREAIQKVASLYLSLKLYKQILPLISGFESRILRITGFHGYQRMTLVWKGWLFKFYPQTTGFESGFTRLTGLTITSLV